VATNVFWISLICVWRDTQTLSANSKGGSFSFRVLELVGLVLARENGF
jgi:hypothetical protein